MKVSTTASSDPSEEQATKLIFSSGSAAGGRNSIQVAAEFVETATTPPAAPATSTPSAEQAKQVTPVWSVGAQLVPESAEWYMGEFSNKALAAKISAPFAEQATLVHELLGAEVRVQENPELVDV